MNAVEMVKQVCKERGISIAKLERDLDFGNGYIGKTKKDTFPVDKAVKIANYLGIDIAPLVGIETNESTTAFQIDAEVASFAKLISENPELRSLVRVATDSKTEDVRMATDMLSRFKEKK